MLTDNSIELWCNDRGSLALEPFFIALSDMISKCTGANAGLFMVSFLLHWPDGAEAVRYAYEEKGTSLSIN